MGTTTRRLQVEVTGRDAGFTATMNRVNAGLSRVGSGLRTGRNEAGLFNRQIMAIGTTARYYLAGQLVFGVQRAISNLSEFKTQLGQIDALAAQVNSRGQLQGIGSNLADVGSEAILMSNKFGIAVTDVESFMQRFFSAFNPPGTTKQRLGEMQTYTKALLTLSTAIGGEAGDPNQLAGGLTGLINATPGGRRHPGQTASNIADMFTVLLQRTPAIRGVDIGNAAGRFASAASLAKMTVPQVLSTFGVAAQTGGSPAVIIRGVAQLLGSSLLHPTKPGSLATYRQAGLPTDPNALASMGGQKVLEGLITFVQQGGPAGSKGRKMNLDAIYNAFSRQESVRQFVNILAQGGIPALRNFNKELKQGVKDNRSKQFSDIRLRQSTLMRMTQARSNLGLSLISGVDVPLEYLIADPIIAASNFAARHRTTTGAVVGTGLSLGAANALRKLGIFKKFGKVGRFLGAASGIEQAAIGGAIAKEELPAAIAGGATDGTRANPFWVIISPLSWSVGSPGGFGSPVPGGGAKIPPIITRGTKWSWLGKAGKYAGPVGLALAASDATDSYLAKNHPGVLMRNQNNIPFSNLPWDQISAAMRNDKTARHLEVTGTAFADLTIKLVDGQGNEIVTTKKKGVPVKLWNARQAPTSKGKTGSRKAP